MDKQSWDLDFTYKGPLQNRMSCHAGDHSRTAICNLIGDQPLFYIDDTVEDDRLFENLLDMEDDGFLPDEDFLDSLRNRLGSYEKSSRLIESVETVPTEQAFDALYGKPFDGPVPLEDVTAFGSQSGTFAAYLDFIETHGIAVKTDAHCETAGYNRHTGIISVNPYLPVMDGAVALLQAMRLAWHHKQGTLINPLRFQPEDAILVNRLLQADRAVVQIEMAWEMNLAGHKEAWTAFITANGYDLCSVYAIEAMTDFRAIKSGLAARAAFEKWFISGRCKVMDRDLIQLMLGQQGDLCFETPETSRHVAADIVARMGLRPQGKNYLTPLVPQIMTDGLFTEVRDRSNANFLWFITFEKNFKETEQHLQEGRMSSKAGSGATKREIHGSGGIVSFPVRKSGTAPASRNRRDEATVFYLDHFRSMSG